MDGPEYRNCLSRAKRLVKDFENLIEKNLQLVEANRKLRANEETYQLRDDARERLLVSLSEEKDTQ